jgi:hypothetical protein
MSEGFGIESPGGHTLWPHRKPVRYLVLIDAGELTIARLFLESREQVAEFDGGAEEVALMTKGLAPTHDAYAGDWDRALQAHTAAERGAAKVYTLDV